MMGLRPGLVIDLFLARRAYDDEQHQLRRETDDHDININELDFKDGDGIGGT